LTRAAARLAACLTLLAAPLAGQGRARSDATPNPLRQFDGAVQALARRVSPAIVQVIVTALSSGDTPHQGGALERSRLIGSGVIVDAGGFIITNAHVVAGAERVRIAFSLPPGPAEGSRALLGPVREARLVGVDNETELALLKVDTAGLTPLPFGDSDQLRKGQFVFAFGSPDGLTNSMSMGVVSAVAREVDPARPVVFIQTDASINPGNSGGALVDADGSLVGINTFILSQSGGSEGLGFAIPSGIVRLVYQQLRAYGHVHRGIIGVRADEVTPLFSSALGLTQSWGLLISDVAPGSPAGVAGLQIGDVVTALNGRAVGSLAEFVTDVTLRNIGRSVKLDLLRGTDRLSVEIPVIERRDSLDRLMASLDPEKNLVRRIGILGVAIDPAAAGSFPPVRIVSGVIVVARALYAGGVETGLQPGDVIHACNRAAITSLDELRQALARLKPGDAAVLQIERQGAFMYLPFEYE
jgi:serine protease Do